MKHGGDLLSYTSSFDGDLIDFSSNINPLGPPEALKEVLNKGFYELTSYPDIKYRNLKKALAKYLKIEVENVIVGNGAMEIIDGVCLLSERIVLINPSFGEYGHRARVHGKEVLDLYYREDFSIDLEEIKREIRNGDTLILGNPNNPTGLRIDLEDLRKIYEIIRQAKGFLLLDEAFYEFVAEDYDSIEIFREYEYEGLGIIRAATKFFALPGIRLGYGCFSESFKERLEEVLMSWSVNTMADLSGNFIFSS